MKSDTNYQSNYINFSGHYKPQLMFDKFEKNMATHSDIAEQKLLNSVNGISQKMPNTLYRDSFVGQIGVDNWNDRNYHQNTSSITLQTGRPQNNDKVYWLGVDVVPFDYYTNPVYNNLK